MKYRCVQGFSVSKCDDDGFETGEEFIVEEGSEWNISEFKDRIFGGEIRLDSDKYGWLEISNESLKAYFEPRKEAADHA